METVPDSEQKRWEQYLERLRCPWGPWIAWLSCHAAILALALVTVSLEFLLIPADPADVCETDGGWLCVRYVPGMTTLIGVLFYGYLAFLWAALLIVTTPLSHFWPQTLKWRSWATLTTGFVGVVGFGGFFGVVLFNELTGST